MGFRMDVKLLSDRGQTPTRGHSDDAGLDIYITEERWVNVGETVDVKTDVAIQIPEGFWGMLVGRSSTLRKRGLLVNTGIIDVGYRGELFVNVHNPGPRSVLIKEGERLAQLIILPNVSQMIDLHVVERLEEHVRGSRGFGSTGL